MQRKMELKIHICVAIVTEVFTQIGASVNIKERVKPKTRRDCKDAQKVLNSEASSQNSVFIEYNLEIPCTK